LYICTGSCCQVFYESRFNGITSYHNPDAIVECTSEASTESHSEKTSDDPKTTVESGSTHTAVLGMWQLTIDE